MTLLQAKDTYNVPMRDLQEISWHILYQTFYVLMQQMILNKQQEKKEQINKTAILLKELLLNPTLPGRFWYLHSLGGGGGQKVPPLDIFFVL